MSTSEELREALLNLEEARKREEHQRQMAEALLAGLHALVLTTDPRELFLKLFNVMRKPLDFEAAFVLMQEEKGTFTPVASSDPLFADTVWQAHAMFNRVIAGHPTAIFDTQLVEEWRSQSDKIRRAARSALHFSIHTAERKAMFVCTHSKRAHFSKDHISLARRFSVLATQALQKLESEARIAHLEERLEAEVKIAKLNKKLAESEKKLARARKMEALGLLAGGVAHDLNNILTGIVSYPELLLMQEDLSPENRSAIQTIQDAGLRAAAVVEDLLTVARGVASPREPVNLNEIIQEYLNSPEYQNLIHVYPGLSITTNLDPELLNIKASRIHIEKALMNLISNAADAVRDKSSGLIVISTENRYIDRPLKGYEDVCIGEYAVLTVSDNGTGISSQDLERIFEPFYTKKIMGRSGTGLGLTVVWNTMQDHEGYVDIITSEQGTAFALYFPVTRDPVREKPPHIPIEKYKGNGQTVLVVDDQENQRKITCALLTKLGYVAEAVSSGEEAIEYVKTRPVDLIVLDMIMDPGINGRETYEKIISIHPNQKAIIA
ncbi:MAG: ATP-binding protein, partial [candidate division KSB1 bacterium]|nr:ATP-binding protein [candidate division KSB1 bacterium]